MQRGILNNPDMIARVYKIKNELYDGKQHDKSGDWHDGCHDALNRVLDILNEYSG